ncbi:VWFA and cache domain-containing protein CG16868 [Musca domestica]|uniref:VWFA and cache domain-containing protein CG16868 n=1 Tax=Musca domestica TaxID=7370 RepID=A0A9J7CZI7_MUSDO|nr:VWFA and cache domain-containing protein CG16868 [Musca domestica]XP_058979557.1 VWFA and cache domain-containing protein CG16868 [Musca domestica]
MPPFRRDLLQRLFVVICLNVIITTPSMVFTYQTTNSNTILQQQNVPLTPTILQQLQQQQQQQQHGGDAKIAAINIPASPAAAAVGVPGSKQTKVPLHYNNATIELVPAAAGPINMMAGASGSLASSSVIINNVAGQQQQQFLQTPANVFFTNYNSQQNVRQLLRNMDERFKNMRNVEMRVATIQEIFDSMHFSSSSAFTFNKNLSINGDRIPLALLDYKLQQDLQHFSKRLAEKIEKALHIVRDLRDFFQTNITQIVQFTAEYEEDLEDDDSDVEPEFDMELNDIERPLSPHIKPLYLNTFIQACYDVDSTSFTALPENYNKQQIQILNYDKTDYAPLMKNYIDTSLLNEKSELTMEANSYIKEKIKSLKMSLLKNDKSPWNLEKPHVGNHIKHIYFLSRSDDASDSFNKFYHDSHFRYLFTSAIQKKYVFLLLDVGSAMSGELLELAKTYISNVLQLLSPNDLISLVCVSDEVENMLLLDASDTDAANGLYLSTRERKEEIMNYINSLSLSRALTNHSLGFEYAFKMLSRLENASLIGAQTPIEFVYVTRGLLTNFSDAMHVLNVVAKGQKLLQKPVVINACGVVLDEKRIMYERQFLTDITSQNYTKYDIEFKDWYKADLQQLKGNLFFLTKMQQETIIRTATAIFQKDFQDPYLIKTWQVHPPIVDSSSKDSIVSVTHAVPPFGVVGVNLYLSDLIEDVTSYHYQQQQFALSNKGDNSYAFLIETNGNTLTHPAFPRPVTLNQTPFPVDIQYLENSTNFADIRQRILTEENGNATTSIYLTKNRKHEKYIRTYQWHNILGFYVLCMVNTRRAEEAASTGKNSELKLNLQLPAALPLTLKHFASKNNIPIYPPPPPPHSEDYEQYFTTIDLIYHRLDLLPATGTTNLCRYFRQISTMDAATLFLSSLAFESPFTFLHNNRISSSPAQLKTISESIIAYLKDTTGLLANPGLRPQIRQEVNALYTAMQHLKKRHQDARGSLKNFIIRRYIASVNGVLQVYPGCLLNNLFDPSQRTWYRKAIQNPGRLVVTEPYLDAAGAGYIITIAHTIFEGKSNALHSIERDQPVAIVAMDVPYAYLYKIILDSTPLCLMHNIKCLLFENEGYLVAHPSMMEAKTATRNQRRPHEHITHKESYLANDILNHKSLVRKLACANYQNRTLQRYYVFNTSLNEILTNVVHGERTKYAIALIKGSNIFAAVLNSTCDGGAFCPCSTIDRQCLNCKRMDQSDCECPCECPMTVNANGVGVDSVTSLLEEEDLEGGALNLSYLNITKQYSYCEPPYESYTMESSQLMHEQLIALPSCVNINCDMYNTQRECLGVMGCEWCQQDLDGNGFAAAFCSAQSTCYNGVLASLSPYGDLDDDDLLAAHGYNPSQKTSNYSAFGPVGGAIIVLAIVIGFAIYCYRHNVDSSSQEQFYMDSMQEENYGLPLSRFNFDDCQADDPPGGGGVGGGYDHTAAQRSLMNAADISPYHMSTGSSYRRPPNGESDHGYSTMTPHEDSSDHQCFTLAEPLLLNDKRHSKSDTMSISTSISSPTNRQQQQQQSSHYGFPSKESRYNLTSPKKYSHSPSRGVYEPTTIPLQSSLAAGDDGCGSSSVPGATHLILAPVTVHRHMETSES